VTWGALGRVTDAAIALVNAARVAGPAHPGCGCVPCLILRLRQALHDAGTPGVLGGPGQQSPPGDPALAPPGGRNPGGDPTSESRPGVQPGAPGEGLAGSDPLSPATAATHPQRAAGDPTEGSG